MSDTADTLWLRGNDLPADLEHELCKLATDGILTVAANGISSGEGRDCCWGHCQGQGGSGSINGSSPLNPRLLSDACRPASLFDWNDVTRNAKLKSCLRVWSPGRAWEGMWWTLAEYPVHVLATAICQRVAFAESAAQGRTVFETVPASTAAKKLTGLVDDVLTFAMAEAAA